MGSASMKKCLLGGVSMEEIPLCCMVKAMA